MLRLCYFNLMQLKRKYQRLVATVRVRSVMDDHRSRRPDLRSFHQYLRIDRHCCPGAHILAMQRACVKTRTLTLMTDFTIDCLQLWTALPRYVGPCCASYSVLSLVIDTIMQQEG